MFWTILHGALHLIEVVALVFLFLSIAVVREEILGHLTGMKTKLQRARLFPDDLKLKPLVDWIMSNHCPVCDKREAFHESPHEGLNVIRCSGCKAGFLVDRQHPPRNWRVSPMPDTAKKIPEGVA